MPVTEATLNRDAMALRWNPVSVPARGQVTLLIFVAQNPNRAAAIAEARALFALPNLALRGVRGADRISLINFSLP